MNAILVLLAALVLGACTSSAQLPSERPADFALAYGWSTGSIPPPHSYSRRLEVAPDGSGTLQTSLNYVDGDPDTMLAFQLSDADLDALYADLVATGGLGRSWGSGNPPPGSRSAWIDVTANGATTEVPSYVSRRHQLKQQMIDVVEGAVPTDVLEAERAWLAGHQQPRGR